MSGALEQLRAAAAAAAFPEDGELRVPGLAAPGEVLRDEWGVPYISAENLDDLWLAQGYVTAGERLFQLDMLLRAANGRLSEVFADRTLADDRFARTVGFARAGERLAAAWDDQSRSMSERFRAGAFAWIERMPAPPVEYGLLDVAPDLPRDEPSWAAAFAYLAWGLSGNWDKELLRAWVAERLGPEAVGTLFPPLPEDPPEVHAGGLAGTLLEAAPRRPAGQGSNAWVVAGPRTATGMPMLANDPHLLALQPGAWIEMHLRAPGYQTRGVALTFSPGVLLGTTAHHAWGVTNVTGDVQDLFVERLNEERTAAEYMGEWHPLVTHAEEIHVRGSAQPVLLDVRETRHGPILDAFVSGAIDLEYVDLSPAETYALRWVGAEHGLRPSLALDVARAGSFEEFRAAVAGVECPGQNFVYADVEGTIGYQCTGLYPVRRAGDGTMPVPGWTDEHEWDGFVPFDELPWAKDPGRGFLLTANNRIHGDDYPHLIGRDFHTPHRALRIADRLLAKDRHTVEDLAAIQTDTVSLPARGLLPKFLAIEPHREDQRVALDLLADWDGDLRADSAAAAVYNAWISSVTRRVLEPRLGSELSRYYIAERETFHCAALPAMLTEPAEEWFGGFGAQARDDVLREALADALAELGGRLGPDPAGWRWGALHRLRLTHPLASIPGLEPLFTAADVELGGDEQTVMQGGFDARDGYRPAVIASWRAVYDLADLDRSVGVLPAGISGNPASPHWSDQSALWGSGGMHRLPFSRGSVEAAAATSLRLTPG